MRIIIAGAGKVGFSLARMLSKEDNDVVVVDRNQSRIEKVEERLDVASVLGSCVSRSVLQKAGIEKADMLVAVTERDELNVVACFIAKSFGVKTTIGRVRSPELNDLDSDFAKKSLGIDLIINPEKITAEEICEMLRYPDATNVDTYNDGRVLLMEFKVTEKTPVCGKMLIDIKTDFHYLIVGIMRHGDMMIPKGHATIEAGDRVFLFCAPEYIPEVDEDFGVKRSKFKDIIIAGGDTVSYYIGKQLLKEGKNIKIIEEDPVNCRELADLLPQALVLNGNASDIQLLKDESIDETDAFLAVTDDDNFNMLSAVIAKELGADRTCIQLKMNDYMPIADSMGIDKCFSPRVLAAGSILKYFHKRNVLSLNLIGSSEAQILEVAAPGVSPILNKPLKDLLFPVDTLLGTIVRNDKVIIPRGGDIILPGDKLFVITLPRSSKSAEKFFEETKGK